MYSTRKVYGTLFPESQQIPTEEQTRDFFYDKENKKKPYTMNNPQQFNLMLDYYILSVKFIICTSTIY